jgi:hypothetical protein
MDIKRVLNRLPDWELDMLDAEAHAYGVTREEMAVDLLREALHAEAEEMGLFDMPLVH